MQNATLSGRTTPTTRATRLSTVGRLFISVLLIVILEGAIRKWVSGSATLPLVLLRDLLVVFTVVRAFVRGDMHRQPQLIQVLAIWSCCVIGWGLLQLVLGESNFAVFLIGLRFWLLYFWFALAVAATMTERDYVVSLRVLLTALVLMAPLVVLQHFSPPGAFVNASLDVDPDDVFVVVAGVVRTTGTFSFTAGFTIFLALCTPFALGVFEARKRNSRQRLLALAIFASLVVSALVSGARAAFIFTGAMLMVYLFSNLLFAPVRRKGSALLMAVLVLIVVAGLAFVFQGAIEVTQQRFETAAESEDLAGRIVSALFGESGAFQHVTWLGNGIGIGSNLAQYVQTGDRAIYVLAESEAGRTLVEGGLLGWLYLAVKFAAVLAGLVAATKRATRTHAVFPLLVWVGLAVATAGWPVIGQLTANALFGVFLALGLLAFKYPNFRLFS